MTDLKLPKNMNLHKFDDRDALAEVFSGEIAHQLDRAIQIRGKASIAVSGGQTPLKLFKLLSQAELDWTRVAVTLVDERWVGPDEERSNERMSNKTCSSGGQRSRNLCHFMWKVARQKKRPCNCVRT